MTRQTVFLGHAAMIFSLAVLFPTVARAVEPAATDKGDSMTYRQAKDFLSQHTKVVELTDGAAAHVLVCPEYQGRVMTSTCDGEDGASLGWINRAFIEAGKPNAQFNNYGGEDRIWLGPEGGQFSLWFAPGAKQEFANWFTPPALNEGQFEPTQNFTSTLARMHRPMKFTNAAKTPFQVDVERDVQLLSGGTFGTLFGPQAAEAVSAGKLKAVGFSRTTL